jgi:hypothetical protein
VILFPIIPHIHRYDPVEDRAERVIRYQCVGCPKTISVDAFRTIVRRLPRGWVCQWCANLKMLACWKADRQKWCSPYCKGKAYRQRRKERRR